jgi:hypothetical protein
VASPALIAEGGYTVFPLQCTILEILTAADFIVSRDASSKKISLSPKQQHAAVNANLTDFRNSRMTFVRGVPDTERSFPDALSLNEKLWGWLTTKKLILKENWKIFLSLKKVKC